MQRHPLQDRILSCFCTAPTCRFSDIRKETGLRSNLLTYHLNNLVRNEVLIKEDKTYSLSPAAESLIPYIQAENLKLAVVVIAIVNKNKILCIKQERRPYKGYWSLPGGRIRFNESISDAAKRVALQETGTSVEVEKLCGVVDEIVYHDKPKHGWLLFLVKATAKKGTGKWFPLQEIPKSQTLDSDKWMIQHLLNKKIAIQQVKMHKLQNGQFVME